MFFSKLLIFKISSFSFTFILRHYPLKCFVFLHLVNNKIVVVVKNTLKLSLPIFFIAFVSLMLTKNFVSANELVPLVPPVPYVHIQNENVILYSDLGVTPLTALPQSHFALITDESGEFYKVLYYDLSGFVRVSSVTKVDFEPKTKWLSGTLTVVAAGDTNTINIRSRPDHRIPQNIIHQANTLDTLIYYGTLQGTAISVNYGNLWYFVKFTIDGIDSFGYVYNQNVNANPIPQNNLEKVMVPAPTPDPPAVITPDLQLPPYIIPVIIIALSIPAVLIMILLFKKPKTKKVPRSF